MNKSVLACLLVATLAPVTGIQIEAVPTTTQEQAVKPPLPIHAPNPPYTEEARQNRISGSALLTLKVKADGTVADVAVIRGLGHGLDEIAVETLKTWKFQPATKDGAPVDFDTTVEVTWRLL
jgi:TonB family protein